MCWIVKPKLILLHFIQDIKGWARKNRATWLVYRVRKKFLYDKWRFCPYYIFRVYFFRKYEVVERFSSVGKKKKTTTNTV